MRTEFNQKERQLNENIKSLENQLKKKWYS